MLSNNQIKNLTPKDKNYVVGDGRGLYLEIVSSGNKLWRFRYTYKGKQNRMSLGSYPEVSLNDARKKRDELRLLLAKGIEPHLEKKKLTIIERQQQIENYNIQKKKLKFEKLKLKADDGNKDALYHLALLYLNGSDEYDIKQDKKIAFNLLLEAVEKGNKFAKETLKLFNQ
jgi:FOG: TPR repeat, SEL1 subfamily